MRHPAKIFAQVFDWRAGAAASTLAVTVEWKQLVAPFSAGKLQLQTAVLASDGDLVDELKLAVARHVNDVQIGANVRASDVIGCGV